MNDDNKVSKKAMKWTKTKWNENGQQKMSVPATHPLTTC